MNSHSDSSFCSHWDFSMFGDFGLYTYSERKIFMFSLYGVGESTRPPPIFFSLYQQLYSCRELLSSRPLIRRHFYYFRDLLPQQHWGYHIHSNVDLHSSSQCLFLILCLSRVWSWSPRHCLISSFTSEICLMKKTHPGPCLYPWQWL